MYKELVCFDFDGTLFHTPEPHEGKKIWQDRTGLQFPYDGWWSKPETLNTDIFHIPMNEWVYRKYLESLSRKNTYVILATGRLERLRKQVQAILDMNNLSFDEVHLNWQSDTFTFKCNLFEKLISKLKVDKFIMYDDRHDHINKFKIWAKGQKCIIEIVDVVNKKTTIINN